MTWIFEDSGAILLECYVDSSAKVVHYLNRSSPLLFADCTFHSDILGTFKVLQSSIPG